MDKEKYIKKWLDGTLTESEKSEFESSEDYKIINKISESLSAFKAPHYEVPEELEKFHNKYPRQKKKVRTMWLAPMLKIAAVLVLVAAGFFYFYLNVDTKISTLAGEKSSVTLPDSSQVDLNALTSLSFKKRMWSVHRGVVLDGEAYFKVAKGSRFDVETTSGTVSVLGTQFNVKNRQGFFEVVCFEGSVAVSSGAENEKLTPGQSFRIINGVVDKADNITGRSPDWINNISSFQSVPFSQVIQEFEIQYGVKITSRGINLDQLFTGKFSHNDMSLALRSIAIPLNIEYELTGENQIIFSGKGD